MSLLGYKYLLHCRIPALSVRVLVLSESMLLELNVVCWRLRRSSLHFSSQIEIAGCRRYFLLKASIGKLLYLEVLAQERISTKIASKMRTLQQL
jgi:hypothetical protein